MRDRFEKTPEHGEGRDELRDIIAEVYASVPGLSDAMPPDEDFQQAYLEAITRPESETPSFLSGEAQITAMQHPSMEEFTEEDLQVITDVRNLGRAIIERAKIGLCKNPDFVMSDDPDELIESAFSLLGRRVGQFSNPDTHAPDAASPAHIDDWPNGGYLNCLGASITMAAASELAGNKYVYVNEIVGSDELFAERHHDLTTHLERLFPGLLDRPGTYNILNMLDGFAMSRNESYKMLYKTPPALRNDQEVRDFHHSVVTSPTPQADLWVEEDPYSRSSRGHIVEGEIMQQMADFLYSPEGATAVVQVDWSHLPNYHYRTLSDDLRQIANSQALIMNPDAQPDLYKSPAMHEILRESLGEIVSTMNYYQVPESASHLFWPYSCMMAAFYTELTGDNRFQELFEQLEVDGNPSGHVSIKSQGSIEEAINKITDTISERVRVDTKAREQFFDYCRSLPVAMLMLVYCDNLARNYMIQTTGSPDVVSELCHPDFAIGAMYLNHYATWRKDGRVNVSRYLTEVCPSQLLWQASTQDGEVPSERARKMAGKIAQLKPSQLHPRVHIAHLLTEGKDHHGTNQKAK